MSVCGSVYVWACVCVCVCMCECVCVCRCLCLFVSSCVGEVQSCVCGRERKFIRVWMIIVERFKVNNSRTIAQPQRCVLHWYHDVLSLSEWAHFPLESNPLPRFDVTKLA